MAAGRDPSRHLGSRSYNDGVALVSIQTIIGKTVRKENHRGGLTPAGHGSWGGAELASPGVS